MVAGESPRCADRRRGPLPAQPAQNVLGDGSDLLRFGATNEDNELVSRRVQPEYLIDTSTAAVPQHGRRLRDVAVARDTPISIVVLLEMVEVNIEHGERP